MADPKDTSSTPIQDADVVDITLTNPITLTLTKQELIVICNVLANNTYTIVNALIVKPILDKIFPLVKTPKEPHGAN